MPSLEQLNRVWLDYLASQKAVPLLGLAPMSDEEAVEAKNAVRSFIGDRPGALIRCLDVHPAITATLLAVTAANTYSEGTFWSRLVTGLGFADWLTGPNANQQRQALTEAFRAACRGLKRPRWISRRSGGFFMVEEFLFHAGFPVCHSRHLASAMRTIDRDGELPDPSEPDAEDRLCDQLLERLGNLPIPTMLRALRGSAGPFVARAALEVLFSGAYDLLNPHLGTALKDAFDARAVVAFGPRLHPPFLRLNEDVLGFEVVCPAQIGTFVVAGRFGWFVNGRLQAWPVGENFLLSASAEDSIEVAASGLGGGASLTRSWLLSELRQPMDKLHVFEAESRRFRKSLPLADEFAELGAGDYWIVLPLGWHCGDANLDYVWPRAVVFHVTIQPGRKMELEGPGDESFVLASRLTPLVLPEASDSALTHEGERLFLGDSLRLQVWLPEGSSGWTVRLICNGHESTFPCELANTEGDWGAGDVDASAFVNKLRPALHEIEAVLLKSGQAKAKRTFVFWAGCSGFSNDGSFPWTGRPQNLDATGCNGFEEAADGLQVSPASAAFRSLTFKIGSVTKTFRWRNAGLFIELVRRPASQPATTQPLALGATLPAAADSDGWLRVWSDFKPALLFFVNGARDERQSNAGGFAEFSLAELAVLHAQGGQIEIEADGERKLVARFASPLRPEALEKSSRHGCRSLDFIFHQRVEVVRPVCVDLVGGRRVEFKPEVLGQTGQVRFQRTGSGLPSIFVRAGAKQEPQTTCGTALGALLETAFAEAAHGHNAATAESRIAIDVPTHGWPEGLWLVSLEAAHRAGEVCETLVGPDGKAAVVLIITEPTGASPELMQLSWQAWQETFRNRGQAWLDWPWTPQGLADAAGFIEAGLTFLPNGPTERLKNDFAWVYLLERAVAAEAERLLRAGDDTAPRLLLDLARSHAGRLRLLRTPEVMAFPASTYARLRHREPAFLALRQCADVSVFDWLSEFVAECPETLADEFLRRFSNYTDIREYGPDDELHCFDIRSYWQVLTQNAAAHDFDPADWRDLLGTTHWQWAWRAFLHRFATTEGGMDTGHANACAHNATSLLGNIRTQLGNLNLVPKSAWLSPWPEVDARYDFEENLPRLCSAFALAARAAGERGLDGKPRLVFAQALSVLRGALPEESFTAGLRALLELAPELFGFFLLFWQTLIKTSPHHA